MKHTPGPWGIRRLEVTYASGNPACFVFSEATGHNVADPAGRSEAETEINARLIAAAPDLLAALEAILADDVEDAGNGYAEITTGEGNIDKARAAIKKATDER